MFLACHIPPANRTEKYKQWIDTINRTEGGYEKFSRGYESFGLHALPNGDVRYREWAPNAVTASLTGDFSELHTRLCTQVNCPAHPAAASRCAQTDGTARRTK